MKHKKVFCMLFTVSKRRLFRRAKPYKFCVRFWVLVDHQTRFYRQFEEDRTGEIWKRTIRALKNQHATHHMNWSDRSTMRTVTSYYWENDLK